MGGLSGLSGLSGISGIAGGTVTTPTIPFAADLLEWWDAAQGISATGGLVDTWTGRQNANVLTGTTTTRPTLITVAGQNYLACDDDYLELPAGFTWDRQNATLVAVCTRPISDTNNRALWHMGTSDTTDATYFNDQDLRFFQGGVQSSGLSIANNITTVVRVSNGATNLGMLMNSQSATVAAPSAGTIAGGYAGAWNGIIFTYLGNMLQFAAYNRALSGAEIQQVQDFFTTYCKSASRTAVKFLTTEGDSLTFGTQSTNPTFYSWPAQMAQGRPSQPVYENVATGGSQIIVNQATMIARTNAQLALFATYSALTVTLWAGSNDVDASALAVDIIAAITSYVNAVRMANPTVYIIGATIINRGGWSGAQTTIQTAVNTFILTGGIFDATVDLQAAPQLSNPGNLVYFNADQTHLTDLGYSVVAGLMSASLVANSRI